MELRLVISACLLTLAGAAGAQETPLPVDPPADAPAVRIGGATMDRTAAMTDNLARSNDHARLVRAIEAAGLAGTLRGMGPFTLFAPTDSAFASTRYEDFEDLLKPENRGTLTDLLRYHLVAGLYDTTTLDARIESGGGQATLGTVLGKSVVIKRSGAEYTVTDATNNTAHLTVTDGYQSNGVVHVVDRVLMPDVR
jgi:uncharacterized surface protein with fasciclin (FAS1) repeats